MYLVHRHVCQWTWRIEHHIWYIFIPINDQDLRERFTFFTVS